MSQPDFIQITDNAIAREECVAIVQRMRQSQQL
ncbi:MAG: 2OG-Fe(II) oxygenase, partial [Xanthomonas euvesicatoria]|nr:2OG-Fe(II) oxygenase [Xanthomonas euvesicatoria]